MAIVKDYISPTTGAHVIIHDDDATVPKAVIEAELRRIAWEVKRCKAERLKAQAAANSTTARGEGVRS